MTGLPGYVEARVRAGAAWSPPVPEPAATVVLLRDGQSAVEVYLMRRAMSMRFARGMYVFPGGRVDERDFAQQPSGRLDAARMSADPRLAHALVHCAVRELAEETGVVVPDLTQHALPVIDHWVTPEVEEHRYDVRFFAWALRADQEPRLLGTEADDVLWLQPAAAIDKSRAGSLNMLPPTLAVLDALTDFDTARSALDALGTRPVQPRLPRAEIDDTDRIRWSLVNAETGEVIRAAHQMPHAWEARGVDA